jgi:alpha-tubulin suppressor-like RCC1 family protein
MGQVRERIFRAFRAGAMGLLLQSCIAPNAQLSFVPEPGSTGGASNLNTFFWSGVAAIPQNTCQPYVLNSQQSGTALAPASSVLVSVGASSGGGFYTNSACSSATGTITLPAGASTVTVYFKASNPGTVFLQAWAQNYALSSYTVVISAVVGPAALLKFTTQPSSTATTGVNFVTQPVVQVQDSNNNLVTVANNVITLHAYQDSGCTTAAGSGTLNATSQTAVSGLASFYNVSYTASTAANIYLQATATGLTSACSSMISVSMPVTMTSVAVGVGSACALASDGTVYCWGDDTYGQLGNGSSNTSGIPTHVLGAGGTGTLSGVTKIAGGTNEFCAVASGNVYCWGDNSNGQLGNNSTTNSSVPVEVLGPGGTGVLSGVTSVSVGYLAACAVTSAGNAYCWGMNSIGQLGNNSAIESHYPVEVVNTTGSTPMTGVTAISAGLFIACAVSSGNVYCWGISSDGALGNNNGASTTGVPVQVVGVGGSGFLTGINSIAVNNKDACAINGSGALFCWGNNGNGQLGQGNATNSATPVSVTGIGSGNVVSMGSTGDTCVTSTAGAAYCWGSNGNGNLGNNSTTQELTPVPVDITVGTPMTGVANISTGGESSCAIISGHVYCWGDNTLGECGQGTTGGTQFIAAEVVSTTGSGAL